MKLGKMLKKGLLTVCTCALVMAQTGLCTAFAEKGGNEKEYTYTVTLYAGKEGTFADGSSEIKITGKKYGEQVNLGDYIRSVKVKNSEKYYVKGIRESGKDNNTAKLEKLAFNVECDREYVVAYGIKGDMVSYTVNYQDESGNALMKSEKFYGVVGDKPVVAFQYIDGYQPQAYNLTKTLSSNEADNVFTFTYKKIASGSNANNGAGNNNGSNNGNGTGTNTGNTGTGANTGNTGNTGTGAANTNNGNNGSTGTANNAGTGNAANNTAGNNQTNNGQTVESADSETPKDQVDLDDEKVPLADINANKDKKAKGRPAGVMYALIGIALAAILGIIILIVTFRKKKHADE